LHLISPPLTLGAVDSAKLGVDAVRRDELLEQVTAWVPKGLAAGDDPFAELAYVFAARVLSACRTRA
jgi:hypothetical protein